jgi:serine/threonine protein kinase/tetratricopeptide (TPR) repeat protein
MGAEEGGVARGASGPDSLSATRAEELDRACDRFEAEWRAGLRPRIEDHLEGIAEPLRSTWLAELIAVELDRRRRLGERPDRTEYHNRFPGHADAVTAAFGPATGRARTRPATPRPTDPAAGLLLGLLAFQNHFVDRPVLLAALDAWVADKARPLGRILLERGALDAATHALLEALAEKHLEAHGGDAEESLAALSSIGSLREDLARIGDAEVQASLMHLTATSAQGGSAERTATLGESTSGGGRFRVLRPHARGGLGEVFVARDTELNREVAIKEIQDRFADDARHRARFEFEAEITGGLEHPGIVPVYGLGHTPDGRPFYAMRFIRGDSLKDAISRFHEAEKDPGRDPGQSTLELRNLLGRFIDVCDAVAYAHSRGVLHRDLKPGNIMLGKYGETLVVDWGLARAIDVAEPERSVQRSELPLKPASGSAAERTQSGSEVGTPAYMSPEQAWGRLDQLGPWSDVYCLGATLYHLLTGHSPYAGEHVGEIIQRVQTGKVPRPRSINPRLAPALEAICLKAMALRPYDRYGSPLELAGDLTKWLADEPVSAYREPIMARLRRSARRHRTLVATSTAVVLVAMGFSGAVWEWNRRGRAAQHERIASQIQEILDQANRQAGIAASSNSVAAWDLALSTARRAEDLVMSQGGGDSLMGRVKSMIGSFALQREASEKLTRLIGDLEEARSKLGPGLGVDPSVMMNDPAWWRHWSRRGQDPAGFYEAFHRFGLPVTSRPTEEVAEQLRSTTLSSTVAAALDDWASIESNRPLRERLLEIARILDKDATRTAVREAISRDDAESLSRLARGLDVTKQPPSMLAYVGLSLLRLQRAESAVDLLRRSQLHYPGDFWIQYRLGEAFGCLQPPRQDLAARCFAAAMALRPGNTSAYTRLGYSLLKQDHDPLGSKELLRRAIALRPTDGEAHRFLADLCQELGDYREALHHTLEANKYTGMIVETWGFGGDSKLEDRLKDVLSKVSEPSREEVLAMADLCKRKRLNRLSSDLYGKALAELKRQGRQPDPEVLFGAACASTLASRSQGGATAVAPTDEERRLYRRRALDWLEEGLAATSRIIEDGRTPIDGSIVRSLRDLQEAPDLSDLRDETELTRLSPAERTAARSFWERVATVLSRVEAADGAR